MNPPNATQESGTAKPLVEMSPVSEPAYTPEPSSPAKMSPFGSTKTAAQRKAAVAAANAELDRMPYILPKKEKAPSRSDILQIARDRDKSAHQHFDSYDLADYSKAVTWIPRFDGLNPDAEKAKRYSLLVAAATQYLNRPHLVTALACAVFALDPQSTVNASNFASSIITAGERLNPSPAKAEALAPYRKDAESAFLYAMAISMKNDAWTIASLTAILNLGNLYIDMGKLEEARSLFQVARKLSPYSWAAALGMAAYFNAIGKPDKALAILGDDNLDRPEKLVLAVKAAKALEKSDAFSELPPGSPDNVYEKGIKTISSEPIATAADFVSQLDQSTRNKMRYFIEHLPKAGSFVAPSIKTVAQYASLKAISSPQGISALKDFQEMLGIYTISSSASSGDQQLRMLSRMGLNIDPGIDLQDLAKHPEKYADKQIPGAKVSGTEQFMANVQKMRKEAETAQRDLATGKTASSIALVAKVDPFFTILQIDPDQYADPMNVVIQKQNFVVHNRKTNLYKGYLISVNKRTYKAVTETVRLTQEKIASLDTMRSAELDAFERQRAQAAASGVDTETAEWKLKKHAIHQKYFVQFNNAAETGFSSATNVASAAYVQRIKPTAEAYYYDVIRHVALISDPDVRDQKEAALRSSMNSALMWALQNVMVAYGSFSYSDDWDCDCDIEALLRQRDAERTALDKEESGRILRNKAARARFASGEMPESSPLFKRLDAYGTDFDFVFIKGRITCARTLLQLKITPPIPGAPELFGSRSTSAFTGASKYDGGLKINIGASEGGVNAGAYLSVGGSVTTDGQGVVKDYSVTAGTGLSVSANGTSVKVGGELTFGPNGFQDSDFSAGISGDVSNGFGAKGNVSFEASTQRGCSLSGKVEQSLDPLKSAADKIKNEDYGKNLSKALPTDAILKLEPWPGKFVLGKKPSPKP
jgi:tetratricopeptide (TPR) repeat protein